MKARLPALRRRRRSVAPANALLSLVAGALTFGLVVYAMKQRRDTQRREPLPDYSSRSGWPEPAEQMRGRARGSFDIPRDMRQPEAWGAGVGSSVR